MLNLNILLKKQIARFLKRGIRLFYNLYEITIFINHFSTKSKAFSILSFSNGEVMLVFSSSSKKDRLPPAKKKFKLIYKEI